MIEELAECGLCDSMKKTDAIDQVALTLDLDGATVTWFCKTAVSPHIHRAGSLKLLDGYTLLFDGNGCF